MTVKHTTNTKRGFTILELLIVISIMAVIATLATGAALKAVKQSRNRRIDATIVALEAALSNYRAQENQWPIEVKDSDGDGYDKRVGMDNATVFKKLLKPGSGGTKYLDGSALLTRVKGKRLTVKQALDKGIADIAIGYPDPNDPNTFKYFTVTFNLVTDSVNVSR